MFEAINWLMAVAASLTALYVVLLLSRYKHPPILWLSWLACVLALVILYFLKALEVSANSNDFNFLWGIGRRWGDASHWFIILLIALGWIPVLGASILKFRLHRNLRSSYVIAAALTCLVYLTLVWVEQQTFFRSESWSRPEKWIQLFEGWIVLFILAYTQLLILIYLVSYIEAVERWKNDPLQLMALLSGGITLTFSIGTIVIVYLPLRLVSSIKWIVTQQMPEYGSEFPLQLNRDLIVYQIIGMVLLPFFLASVAVCLNGMISATQSARE